MKKVALSLAALASAMPLQNAEAFSAFRGTYVGVMGGLSHIQNKGKASYTAPPPSGTFSHKKNATGGVFGALLGYSHTFGTILTAVEANIQYDTAEADNSNTLSDGVTSVKLTAKRGLTYGISGRVGVLHTTKLLIFGRIGCELSHFKFGSTVGGESKNATRILPVLNLGLGCDYVTSPNVILRGEYNFALMTNKYEFNDNLGTFTGKVQNDLRGHYVKVAAIYRIS